MANLRNVAALVLSVGLPVAACFVGTIVGGGGDDGTLGFRCSMPYYIQMPYVFRCFMGVSLFCSIISASLVTISSGSFTSFWIWCCIEFLEIAFIFRRMSITYG